MPTKKRLSRAEAKARTREELLKAARVVFARNGFHGSSLDMVAEAAGYTKGAVYANFSGKDDLFLALLDNHLAEGTGGLEDLVTSGVSLELVLDKITENFFEELNDNRGWAALTLEFYVHALRNETFRTKLVERVRLVQEDIKKWLEKRIAITGVDLPISAEQTAAALLAFTNGIDLMALVDPQPEFPAVYAKMLKLLLGLS